MEGSGNQRSWAWSRQENGAPSLESPRHTSAIGVAHAAMDKARSIAAQAAYDVTRIQISL
jgi:hypothetical protein